MNASASSDTGTGTGDLSPVKFSRLSRRGILLGLSGLQLVMSGIAAGSLVAAVSPAAGLPRSSRRRLRRFTLL